MTPRWPVRAVGGSALLVDLPGLDEAVGLHDAVLTADPPLPGVVELVPAARTLLVRFAPEAVRASALASRLASLAPAPPGAAAGPVVTLDVRYDGEDLDAVAELVGLRPAEVAERHAAREYVAAFAGFAPGFVYLAGGDPLLDVPRLATPRTRVPAGAVAIAAEFSGVYPRSSPGGWRLLGTTGSTLWDETSERPAAIGPGDRVRFVPTREVVVAGGGVAVEAPHAAAEAPAASSAARGALLVERPGPLALVQDLGRPGLAALGVSRSGAADRPALRSANRAVGNPPGAAALEMLLGGFAAVARGRLVVAVAGAPAETVVERADGERADVRHGEPTLLDDGDRIVVGMPSAGLRTLLAVRGGIDVPAVLGSRSRDTLAAIGPAPLAAGDILRVGAASTPGESVQPVATARPSTAGASITVEIDDGPRADWFDEASGRLLREQQWTVGRDTDRVGVRLDGERALVRSEAGELPSEAMVAGAIQVPPSGSPVVFLADAPVTGGYPVIAVVRPAGVAALAQAPPGTLVRFADAR